MRIIGGRHKGRVLKVPAGLPVRPTTDFAKEGLFNILTNQLDFEAVRMLDLFTGTGHISFEFASRGSKNVTAVDQNIRCVSFVRETAAALELSISTIKEDVFRFLEKASVQYDVIFADPPYDLVNIADLHEIVFRKSLLAPGGLLIIEHGSRTKLDDLAHFDRQRKYGNVNFSFFRAPGL